MPIGRSNRSPTPTAPVPRLLIATNNKGKVLEIRALLQDLQAELVTPADIGLHLQVAEDGSTYAENARSKAVAFAQASGLISLADDSGLEVEALGGAPGVRSARYLAKPGATDAERRSFLLRNLRDEPRPWLARFRSAVAIAVRGAGVQLAEGHCDGEIIPDERGTGGFGYDRIFYIPAVGQTMAELSLETKNRLSHRAQAVMHAWPILEQLFD
jgi:XTP/dITP diphosphohydrolase